MDDQRPSRAPLRHVRLWLAPMAGLLLAVSACASLTGDEQSDAEPDVVAGDSADGSESDPAGNEGGADEEVASATTSVEPSDTVESTDPPEVEMPDLIGSTEAEARAELADLGLEEPSVSGRESFEPAGTVLEQVPSDGRVVTGTISLVVAESIPPLPDFVGSAVAEVRSWAEPRGIDVQEETKLTTDQPTGVVLDQLPAAGAEASQELIVTVAAAPTIVELANLGAVNERCYKVDDISMNGTLFPQSPFFQDCESFFAEFNLSRDWRTLKFTAGLNDNLSADGAVQLEMIVDGQSIYNETIVFGETTDVELDVTDGLRLQVVGTQLSGRNVNVGLGNAQLLGGSSGTG